MACSAQSDALAAEEPELGSYNCPKIGTDKDGADHFYDPENHRVFVASGGELAGSKSLGDRTVEEWKNAVAKRVGWKTLGVFDELAHAFREDD